MTDTPINSPEWWDSYHRETWAEAGGPEQTRLFMESLLESLPERVVELVRGERLSIVDWGCAAGDGAAVLARWFPGSDVGGLDISGAAVAAARRAFPDLDFRQTGGTALPEDRDVVVVSNCLEHFRAPLAVVAEHLERCRWLYVVLVPHNEHPLHQQHLAQFREESWPRELRGFTRVVCNVIRVAPEAWDGDQLLVVYASRSAVQRLDANAVGGGAELEERLDGLRASVDLLLAERDWRAEARRIWRALEHEQAEHRRLREHIESTHPTVEALVARAAEASDRLERARRDHAGDRRDLESRIDELERRGASLAAELAASQSRLEQSCADAERVAREFADYRAWVEGSRVLRLARKTGSLRTVVFPRGSWRERVAWQAKLRASRLWQSVRRIGAPRPVREPAPRVSFAGCRPGTVTVVLPVYNQAELLASAIDSVLAQEFGDFELICLDDGSTDGVGRVLERYVRDPRVRVLTQPNQGLPKALSNAFEFATGEFWCWTSADNLMEPAQLGRQAGFLRRDEDVAMVYCDYYAIDDRGEPLRDPSWRPHNRRPSTSAEIHLPRHTRELNVVKDNFIGPCFMYRGVAGRVLGEYDPRIGMEDYDYWMRMNHLFRIEHLGTDELLYRYRVHDNSLSGRAVELGIYAAGDALMDYERGRARAYAEPVRVVIDDRVPDLAAIPESPDAHRADPVVAMPTGPAVIVTSAARVAELAAAGLPDAVAVAVVADAGGDDVFRHRVAVRASADHCIATAADVADFVGVLHPSVFSATDLGQGIESVRRSWQNDVYYRSHRNAELRRRRLPRPFFGADPMRILIQVDTLGSGGLEQATVLFARHLAASGRADVRLLVTGDEPGAAARRLLEDLEWRRLPSGAGREDRYRDLLRAERIDVVSAVYSTFGAEIAAQLAVPFVQTIQNTYVWLAPQDVDRLRRADAYTAAYLCVSDRVAYYSWKRLGLDPRKMLVVPNPTRALASPDPAARRALRAELGVAEGRFLFLSVASLYPPKAQIVLVEAVRELVDRGLDVHVVCLGPVMDPAYRELVERRASRLEVLDRLTIREHTDDVAAYYGAADAFALPSYWEGWSLAANEAASFGLPLVLSRVGAAEELASVAHSELVDVPFGDVGQLDAVRIGAVVGAPDPRYVSRFAEAMARVVAARRTPRERVVSPLISADVVFDACANVVGWVAQGGVAAAARGWTHSIWRSFGRGAPRAFRRSEVAASP